MLINSDNLVMCGDFNIDLAIKNKTDKDYFIKLLKEYGYESIYHKKFNEEISSFAVGDKEDYVDKWSDHVPLIFEVDI